MKQFLENIIKFSIAFSVVIALLLFWTLYIYSFISFKIPEEKDIIILGDSHTQCSINDNIFSRSINISDSSESYLYSFCKLRKILSSNLHIKKVILSFHGGSIVRSRDNWIFGEGYIKSKIPRYIYLFNKEEYLFMMKKRAFYSAVLKFPIYSKNIVYKFLTKRSLIFTDLQIGGYLWLDRDKLDEDIKLSKNIETDKYEYSKYELNNLFKIVELCIQHNVELILLNSPTYGYETYGRKTFLANYYKQYFPTIKYLDFSDFTLPLYGYGDIGHLNYKGAEIFSRYLEKNFETIF